MSLRPLQWCNPLLPLSRYRVCPKASISMARSLSIKPRHLLRKLVKPRPTSIIDSTGTENYAPGFRSITKVQMQVLSTPLWRLTIFLVSYISFSSGRNYLLTFSIEKARWAVTNRTNVAKILEATGTSITTKGSFYPTGKEPQAGENPKLYILVEGDTEVVVTNAMRELMRLLKEGTIAAADSDARAPTTGRYNVV